MAKADEPPRPLKATPRFRGPVGREQLRKLAGHDLVKARTPSACRETLAGGLVP